MFFRQSAACVFAVALSACAEVDGVVRSEAPFSDASTSPVQSDTFVPDFDAGLPSPTADSGLPIEMVDVCEQLPLGEWQPDGQGLRASFVAKTSQNAQQHIGSCGGSGGEQVMHLVAPDTGYLTLELESSHDAVLYVRSDCADPRSELACADTSELGGKETFGVLVDLGTPLFVFADGLGKTHGDVRIDAKFHSVTCGNGIIEVPETCEDNNDVPDDGCDACSLSRGTQYCPGTRVQLHGQGDAPRRTLVRGTIMGAPAQAQPLSCQAPGPELIYAVNADVDGSLRARITRSDGPPILYIRGQCGAQSSQKGGCAEPIAGALPVLDVPVMAEQTVYVVVDVTDVKYPWEHELELTLTPAHCGNGLLDPFEQCDDANDLQQDGCHKCLYEVDPVSADRCPGLSLNLVPNGQSGGYRGQYSGSTRHLQANYLSQSIAQCAARDAKDAVVSMLAPSDGKLRATLVGNFDAALQVRTLCDIEAPLLEPSLTFAQRTELRAKELSCTDAYRGVAMEQTAAFSVQAGERYYFIVSSRHVLESGEFTLQIEVESP